MSKYPSKMDKKIKKKKGGQGVPPPKKSGSRPSALRSAPVRPKKGGTTAADRSRATAQASGAVRTVNTGESPWQLWRKRTRTIYGKLYENIKYGVHVMYRGDEWMVYLVSDYGNKNISIMREDPRDPHRFDCRIVDAKELTIVPLTEQEDNDAGVWCLCSIIGHNVARAIFKMGRSKDMAIIHTLNKLLNADVLPVEQVFPALGARSKPTKEAVPAPRGTGAKRSAKGSGAVSAQRPNKKRKSTTQRP